MGHEVYNLLLSRFISSDIDPGSRVTIDALAREFEVSPTPIREALGRLELSGLVVRQLNAGYRVAPKMTRDQFENLIELRTALEPLAARRAAENMDGGEIAELQALADRMTANDESGDRDAYALFAQDDAMFHDTIAMGGGNDLIRDALGRLHIHIRLFRLIYQARIRTDALEEHARVLEAIKSGDPESASYQMRRHILRSADRFRQSFDT